MKRIQCVLSLLLALVMTLSLLPVGAFAATQITEIYVVGFQTPVVGQTASENLASVTVPDGAHYQLKNSFWVNANVKPRKSMDSDDVFEDGPFYYTQFTVKPDAGYEFDESTTLIKINNRMQLVDGINWLEDGSVVFYSIDIAAIAPQQPQGEVITAVDVLGYETPVINQSLAGHLHGLSVPGDAPYVIHEMGWYVPSSEEPLNDFTTFEKDQVLILAFTIAPVEGYRFDDEDYPNATINGSDELIGLGVGYYIDTQGLFHYETVEIQPVEGETIPITEIVVNGYEPPVAGETVSENLAKLSVPADADYFIRDAKWRFEDTFTDLGGDYEFQAETSYYLCIEIRPTGTAYYDEECTFSVPNFTVAQNMYTNAGLTIVGAPVTVGEAGFLVSQVTVKGVMLPVVGQTVKDNLSSLSVPAAATYAVSDAYWISDGSTLGDEDVFEADKTYVLWVTVTMNDGWFFDMINGEIPSLYDTADHAVTVDVFSWQAEGINVHIPTEGLTATAEGDVVWGDANGDKKISNLDVVRLKNYLANFDEDTGISSNGDTVYTLAAGADANGDSKISNLDIVRLKNYLANYDEDAGISSNGSTVYVLGPAQS